MGERGVKKWSKIIALYSNITFSVVLNIQDYSASSKSAINDFNFNIRRILVLPHGQLSLCTWMLSEYFRCSLAINVYQQNYDDYKKDSTENPQDYDDDEVCFGA